ncbi:MAG: hypothetical protein COV72_00520 [Candidatus Omnitrophica bacterium CG11_big_fil_rev_8_21_14_0_20_42_13]|uniref:DNA photolyase n=1 Tax=Candidatus Ghiorseimicrobium undicola TaxID=1974746 RepID=A0A2H0LZU1_9BACT|nr:MAG: hypothetical protein COV72_00520 [Candidatus Omnitrophica bacterium CG11_big_fil_rev_8_21_14_0_20_42_13]
MPNQQKSASILNKTNSLVKARCKNFGPNKKQEISRLIFEIAKRENIPPSGVAASLDSDDFHDLKASLLKRRFPIAYAWQKNIRAYLAKPQISSNRDKADLRRKNFMPKRVFAESAVKESALLRRLRQKFPQAKVHYIDSLKAYIQSRPRFTTADYNLRRDRIFITRQQHDFFKKCPCTKNALSCGYHVFNLGFGCIFDCSYCYLQEYSNAPGIILPADTGAFFRDFPSYYRKNSTRNFRIGSGEFSDSLMLDDLSEYSPAIVDFMRGWRDAVFEFKTKSTNIANLLKAKHGGNIVVSWSLNPQGIIDKNEFFTASLAERLAAAVKIVSCGYRAGFHFDPIFYFSGWRKQYLAIVDSLFDKIKAKDIAWISLGTFRFSRGLKSVIEARFPDNRILDGELILGYDNKLRYPDRIRLEIYDFMIKALSRHCRKIPLYLCMEDISMWRELGISSPFY